MMSLENQAQEYSAALQTIGEIVKPAKSFYDSVESAQEHRNTLINLEQQINRKLVETDPYAEQIDEMENEALQEITWNTINDLARIKDHQEFLLKLLTNKDSFIRKRIIEQNLQYLNTRLNYYLAKLGLPHEVQFKSDLTVEITELGRELDFDNLSRGERNRLILGLSWAFRDVHESTNMPIDFMAIDELIDSGMDSNGVESALGVLKKNRLIGMVPPGQVKLPSVGESKSSTICPAPGPGCAGV
jgi:DNA repair exonuclease SbcCD ATPase subunit